MSSQVLCVLVGAIHETLGGRLDLPVTPATALPGVLVSVLEAVAGPQPLPLLAEGWLPHVERLGGRGAPGVVEDGSLVHVNIMRPLPLLIAQLKRGGSH